MLPLVQNLAKRHALEFFSIGGGLGIIYDPALASGSPSWWQSPAAKNILTPQSYANRLLPLLQPLGLKILMEPGRFFSGNATPSSSPVWNTSNAPAAKISSSWTLP